YQWLSFSLRLTNSAPSNRGAFCLGKKRFLLRAGEVSQPPMELDRAYLRWQFAEITVPSLLGIPVRLD
ncbi:hypothetical protein QUA35_14810, partial [Microcoleus sp. N9_B2]|uniref:hypothetical protein n=1 Tax=unclassified Microcoleus TaxID=2642155 RepID=UPI002FCFCECE